MVLPKSKHKVGLGRALQNDHRNQRQERHNVSKYTTGVNDDAGKLRSVTQERSLDEFLSTAELAGTDFTAERQNVRVIEQDQRRNPFLLSPEEAHKVAVKQRQHAELLRIPRRPHWDHTTTPAELNDAERASFIEWRRGLAALTETHDLLLTPFERNLEVWRQLWRVIERSDLVVQIIDARNPLFYRSRDLEVYVKQVDPHKRNFLLINKADLLTDVQRKCWADYFDREGVQYSFFSAMLATDVAEQTAQLGLEPSDSAETAATTEDRRIRIVTVAELEELFASHSPLDATQHTTIGLVGYPNVGKSSTINAIIGAKKVSVSATPGKTKHFQTLNISPNVTLCDCPGLVFPNFASTQADLVVNGVLPIDQLREFRGPAGLVAQRIPKHVLEQTYTIHIIVRPADEGGDGVPTADELLNAYAASRGFWTTGMGNPDAARAARYLLKDYVNGRLLFCHPPPDSEMSEKEYNEAGYGALHFTAVEAAEIASRKSRPAPKGRTQQLDSDFFTQQPRAITSAGSTRAGQTTEYVGRGTFMPHQNMLNSDASARDDGPVLVTQKMMPKKHGNKGKKPGKRRGAHGYDAAGNPL